MVLKSIRERKDELIQKLSTMKETNNSYDKGIKKGISEAFHSFSDLIEAYLKYQNNVKLLMSEEKIIWKKWILFYEQQSNIAKSDYINIYNEWLFDYLFCNRTLSEEIFTSLY
jgi:hypothetical protein